MHAYTHQYLNWVDVINHNNLDREKVNDALLNSDVSYGTNGDTLITKETFENILYNAGIIKGDLDYDGFEGDEFMISLGC